MATVSVKLLDAAPPYPSFSFTSMQCFLLVPVSYDAKYTHARQGHVLLRHRAIKSSSCLAKENLFDDILTGRTLLFCFKYNK